AIRDTMAGVPTATAAAMHTSVRRDKLAVVAEARVTGAGLCPVRPLGCEVRRTERHPPPLWWCRALSCPKRASPLRNRVPTTHLSGGVEHSVAGLGPAGAPIS